MLYETITWSMWPEYFKYTTLYIFLEEFCLRTCCASSDGGRKHPLECKCVCVIHPLILTLL